MQDTKLPRYESLIRRFPDFPKPGIVFIDWMPVLGDARAFDELIKDMMALVSDQQFTKVASLETRGYFLGLPIAHELGVPFVPVRKKGKLPGPCISQEYALEYGKAAIEIQQDAISRGDAVLVVDDLLATGGTMRAANQLIGRITHRVFDLFFIELDGLHGAELLDAPFRSLYHTRE